MAAVDDGLVYNDPNFGVIWSFIERFGEQCGISSELTITNLQLMLEDTRNVHQDLIDLHIKLLRKSGKKNVPPDKWEKAIVKFCHSYSKVDAWEIERFGYKKSKLCVKLVLLKQLLESQFDGNSKFKTEINKLSANDLRLLPIGKDIKGKMYWFHQDRDLNLRIYREDLDDETWEVIVKERDELVALISNLENHSSPKKEEVSTTPSDTGESKDGEMSLSNSLSNSLTVDCKSDVKLSSESLQFLVPERLIKSIDSKENIFIKPESIATETSIKPICIKQEDQSFKIEEETVCCQDDLKEINSRLPIKIEPMDIDIKDEKLEEDKDHSLKSFTNALCSISPNSSCNRDNAVTKDQEASLEKSESELSVVVRESVIRIAEKICVNESLNAKETNQQPSENRIEITNFSAKNLDSTSIPCNTSSSCNSDVSSKLKISSPNECHSESNISSKSNTDNSEHVSVRKRMPLKKREIPKDLDADVVKVAAISDASIGDNTVLHSASEISESKTSDALICDDKKSKTQDSAATSAKPPDENLTQDPDLAKTRSSEEADKVCDEIKGGKEQSSTVLSGSPNFSADESEKIKINLENENNSSIKTGNSNVELKSSNAAREKSSPSEICVSKSETKNILTSDESLADTDTCAKSENADNESSQKSGVKENCERDVAEKNIDTNESDKNKISEKTGITLQQQLQISNASDSEPEISKEIGVDEQNKRKSESGVKEHIKSLEPIVAENSDSNGVLTKVQSNCSPTLQKTKNKKCRTLEKEEKTSIEIPDTSAVVDECQNEEKEKVIRSEQSADILKLDSPKTDISSEISKDCSDIKESVDEKNNNDLKNQKSSERETSVDDEKAMAKDKLASCGDESKPPSLMSEVGTEQAKSSELAAESLQKELTKEIICESTATQEINALKSEEITAGTTEKKLDIDESAKAKPFEKENATESNKLKESPEVSKSEDCPDLVSESHLSPSCTSKDVRENESCKSKMPESLEPEDEKLLKDNKSNTSDKMRIDECENEKACLSSPKNIVNNATTTITELNGTSCQTQEELPANDAIDMLPTEEVPAAPKKRKRKGALSDLGPIENLPVKRSPRLQAQRLKVEDQQRKIDTELLQKQTKLMKKSLAEERKQKRAAKAIQKEEIVAAATVTNGKVSKKRGRPKKKVVVEEIEIPVKVLSKKKRVRKRRSKLHLKRKKPAIVSRKKKRSNNPWETSSGSSYSSSEAEGVEGEDEENFEEEDEELVFNDKSDHEFDPESESEENIVQPQTIKRARTVKKEKTEIGSDSECSSAGDDKPCNRCSKQDHPEWILLCDKCDSGYHTSCLRPPLMVIPDGDWFCPPCCHVMLLEKLNEQLKIFDQLWKKKDRDEMRKKRLAYVGISLDNVLKPEKERKDAEEEEEDYDEDQEEESDDESVEEVKEYVLVRKRSRRARKEVSYRFKEYDELIKSAIHEEAPQIIEIKAPPVVVVSKGKDISNIDGDQNQISEEKESEVKKEESDETEDDDDDDDRSRKKKKHKRLNDLNSSSSEEQDNESDEDFQQSSVNSEQSEEDSFGGGEESENSWDDSRSGRSRAKYAKYGRRGDDFVDDGSDDSYDSRRKGRRAATKTVNYREVSESDDDNGRSKKKSRQLYSRPFREPRESDNDSDWRKPSKRSRFESSPKSNKRLGKMWRLESDEEESEDEDNNSKKLRRKSVVSKRDSNEKSPRMRVQDYVRKSEDEEEEESSSPEESENSNDEKDEEKDSEDTDCEGDKKIKQNKLTPTDEQENTSEVPKLTTKSDSKADTVSDDHRSKALESQNEQDTSLASEDSKNSLTEKGERGKQSQAEFLERPTPLHPSIVDAYSVRSSPSKLTLLDNYSSRSSPQKLTPLELYPPSPSAGVIPPYDRDRPPRPPLAHQIPPSSHQFHGEYDNYPGQYYPPGYPHGSQFSSSPPAGGYHSPSSTYPSYQQPSPNYGFVPQPYGEQGLYQGQGPHFGPAYPNYSPPPPPPPPPQPPAPATTQSGSTSQSQPNGRFSIDNLLQRRIESSEDDEFSSVTELVSYITGSHDNPL